MRGAATKTLSDIVEERQQSRRPPAAAPLRAAARRPAAKCEFISARALSWAGAGRPLQVGLSHRLKSATGADFA